MTFCTPWCKQCLPFVYKSPISSIVLSLNSHRKMKTAPLLKNIPHQYEKIQGFRHPFWWSLARYLQFIYRNWPSNGICAIGLSEKHWITIKTSKWGLAPWLKIAPHLIGQKMGKMYPSPRIVYFLFTKIDCCKQKMRLSAHKKRPGRFELSHPTFCRSRVGEKTPPYNRCSSRYFSWSIQTVAAIKRMDLSAEKKDGSWKPPFLHYSAAFLHFRLSFVASKLTFTRNCTKFSGASGRSTDIQWSLFMW